NTYLLGGSSDDKCRNTAAPSKSPVTTEVQQQTQDDFFQFPLEQQLKLLNDWNPATGSDALPVLKKLVETRSTSPMLIAAALRAAIRLDVRLFAGRAEEYLRQTDMNLVNASLEYMAFADLDKILPTIDRYLTHQQPRLRSTAVLIFKRADPHQALASMQNLLRHRDLDKQEAALAGLIHFDFSLVREMLTQYLRSCKSKRAFESGLCLFQANPDPENLFSLEVLEPAVLNEFKIEVRKARDFIEAAILDSGLMDSQALQAFKSQFPQRFSRQQARLALKSQGVSAEGKTSNVKISPDTLLEKLGEFKGVFAVVTICLIVFCIGLTSRSSETTSTSGQVAVSSVKLGSELRTVITVMEIDPKKGGMVLEDRENNRFLVFPQQDGFTTPSLKSTWQVKLVPFRRGDQGIIHARLQELTKP
ncbi:MAG TPA: hypothetical protein PKO06_23140, partial [Candidatus Ozemobacteraceae bacterium]|nr:hypothetical protein [Candidatus Ozemobacteraceae bacterium]